MDVDCTDKDNRHVYKTNSGSSVASIEDVSGRYFLRSNWIQGHDFENAFIQQLTLSNLHFRRKIGS